MPSFQDEKKRVWIVRVTPLAMREVRDFCGVNLGTILRDDMQGLINLLDDPVDLCSVMYGLCKTQCDAQGVSLDEFLDSIVGQALADAAQALVEGLQETFPPNETIRLAIVLKLMKENQRDWQRKLDDCMSALTGTGGRSPWRRIWAWIRGSSPVAT